MNPELLRRISEEFERIEQAAANNERINLDALFPDLQGTDRETALAETRELLEELHQSQEIASAWISAASMSARYDPVEPIKKGGMGEIWIAIDQDFHRKVAIKEILPESAHDPRIRKRFLRESLITAKLEHPGILPVYSKGAHADGRPFYAMRWVSGNGSQTLHDAISVLHSNNKLSTQQFRVQLHGLLNRFVSVCQTVAFAHHSNVIHRDLKPSNILLGPFGETFVVDWGLAVDLTESEKMSSDEFPAPDTADFFGTPSFSAPECLDNPNEANPRCDIFSLGMILHHLCVGVSPYTKSQKRDPKRIKSAIAQREAKTLRQIDPKIHPALEAICAKATAFHPLDRYPTALDLAQDITTFLNDETITAWKEPWTFRTTRWLKKRIATVVAFAVASTLLLLSALGYLWISHLHSLEISRKSTLLAESLRAETLSRLHAIDAVALAQDREQLANNAIETFWSEVAQDPTLRFSEEFKDLRLKLLARPMEYYKTLSESYRKAAATTSEAMASFVDSRFELSKLQLEAGQWSDALENIQQVFQDTEKTVASSKECDNSWLYRQAKTTKTLARIYAHVGDSQNSNKMNDHFASIEAKAIERSNLPKELEEIFVDHAVETARILSHQGKSEQANDRIAAAMKQVETICERFPKDIQSSILKERVLNDAALIKMQQGDFEQARNSFRLLLAMHEQMPPPVSQPSHTVPTRQVNPEEFNRQFRLGSIEFNLGVIALRSGNNEESLQHHSKSLDIRKKLSNQVPSVAEFQKTLGHSYLAISNLLMQRGQLQEGIDSFRSWVQINRLLYARQPSNLPQKMELVSSLHQLGHFLQLIGDKETAISVYNEALPLAMEIKTLQPEEPIWQRHRIEISEQLGTLYFDDERWQEAYDQFQQAIEGLESVANGPDAAPKDRTSYRSLLMKMPIILEHLGDAETKQEFIRRINALDPT
jgi:serine/threonine protein kinase